MKEDLLKLLMLGIILLTVNEMMAQFHPNAQVPFNNVNALVSGTGTFSSWRNDGQLHAGYYVPANGEAKTIYSQALWLGGIDSNDSLRLSAYRFGQMGDDYWSGPLRVTDGTTDINAVMQYHNLWIVTREEVNRFLANPSEIPASIMNWPGNGDTEHGFAKEMAPYVDVDGDGNYNPENGDYPDFKGDKAVFFVFNDSYDNHTESGGEKIGLEVQCLLYAFNAPDDEILNNTIFLNYKMFNRSSTTLHDAYLGLWTDFDIGYEKDDYVGCDVGTGTYFGYNGMLVDGTGDPGCYGQNHPAQTVTFLAGPCLNPDGTDNPKYDENGNQIVDESINGFGFGDGIIDNERLGLTGFMYHNNTGAIINGDPESASEYYLYLKGLWKNGSSMQYGGSAVPGAPNVVGPECKFMFPDDSDPWNWGTGGIAPNGGYNTPGHYWSEDTADNGSPNEPGDRRGLGVAGPFTFNAGEMHELDVALITVWKSDATFAVSNVRDWSQYIRNYFLNNVK